MKLPLRTFPITLLLLTSQIHMPFFCLLYCGHFWPIVPAPDDRWGWLWSNWWNEDWQGKPKYSEKTCPSATLSTTNPTWPDPGSNPGRLGGKPATNRLSYVAAIHIPYAAFYRHTISEDINFNHIALVAKHYMAKDCKYKVREEMEPAIASSRFLHVSPTLSFNRTKLSISLLSH
jgi:hypothetical protein